MATMAHYIKIGLFLALRLAGIPCALGTAAERRTVVGCHECGWSAEWNEDTGFTHYNFSLLTQINFHSAASLHPNGTVSQAGVNGPGGGTQCDISDTNASSVYHQIRELCEANGVRLVLSIGQPATTGSEMLDFLHDNDATALAVKELTAAAVARKVGGLSLDWEGSYEFDVNATSALVSFFGTLRGSLRAAIPGATLTYPIDGFFNPSWITRFNDVQALANSVDLVFLMCYDSTGLWGQPHPRANANSPLVGGPADYGYDIAWQVNESLKGGMPANQIVVGVPWYGREWPVFGPGIDERMREIRLTAPNLDPTIKSSEKTGLPLSAVEARNRSATYSRRWDNITLTPYYNFVDHWGQWGLGTYDDAQSLGLKYDFAVQHGVGIGIWAINYPMGDEQEWSALEKMQQPS